MGKLSNGITRCNALLLKNDQIYIENKDDNIHK